MVKKMIFFNNPSKKCLSLFEIEKKKLHMSATDIQSNLINMKGASTNVMRKSDYKIWLWLVDNPFATPFFAD